MDAALGTTLAEHTVKTPDLGFLIAEGAHLGVDWDGSHVLIIFRFADDPYVKDGHL